MLQVRSDASAVLCKDLIYCIGGFTGEVIHDSVEAINPEDLLNPNGSRRSLWFPVAEMNTPRSGVSCEVFGDYIYAVGGYDGEKQLSSIERCQTLYVTICDIIAYSFCACTAFLALIALTFFFFFSFS